MRNQQPDGGQELALLLAYPFIAWDTAMTVIVLSEPWFACRYCAALYGLKGSEVAEKCFRGEDEFARHLSEHHGRRAVALDQS
jgi:hypothetical protein